MSTVCAADRRRLFEVAGLLLTYPDADLLDALPAITVAASHIEHAGVRDRVTGFLEWCAATGRAEVEQHYVATFDLRRRSGLYLTYYLHGDTRKRGVALLTLKSRYRAHGLRLAPGELPDLLPVVLEFAATVGPGDGEAPLRQHRRGVELLRAALADVGSPYAALLEAISLALPPLTDGDRAAIAALAADGPPVEAVGLAPYSAQAAGPADVTCMPTHAPEESLR